MRISIPILFTTNLNGMKEIERKWILISICSCLAFSMFISGCTSNDIPEPFDCSTSDLNISILSTSDATGCTGKDGSITVSASAGEAPYQFNINASIFSAANSFNGLAAGTYTIIVKDAKGCERSIQATVNAEGSDLAAIVIAEIDNECLTNNGSISIEASGGVPPYVYRLGNGDFVSNTSFINLKHGSYNITVRDSEQCSINLNTTVQRGNTGISFSGAIKNIIDTRCAIPSCHSSGTGLSNFTNFSNVQSSAQAIKTRTTAKTMPPSGATALTDEQIARIACWVDDGANNN
jgi:hypothetical protein